MPMRKQRHRETLEQLNLFVPARERPTWTQLSPAVRQQITELVAELLRQQHEHTIRPASEREVADE